MVTNLCGTLCGTLCLGYKEAISARFLYQDHTAGLLMTQCQMNDDLSGVVGKPLTASWERYCWYPRRLQMEASHQSCLGESGGREWVDQGE